jgi:hypothetical protein
MVYNDIDFGRELRTMQFSIDPVKDPVSGVDLMYQRVTIEVSVVLNPFWFATNKMGAFPEGEVNDRFVGDRMGLTIANLREVLMTPRKPLHFSVGPDLVIQSPDYDTDTGDYLPSDCKNGPHPLGCKVIDIVGDKSAMLFFKIETYVSYCEKMLLSNRWTMSCDIDQEGYTTRTTRGKAVFRSDLLAQTGANPDDFRRFLLVPAQDQLRRINVHVGVSADGTELDYSVTDRETTYGLGADSAITRIEGNTTSGGQIDITQLKDAMNVIGDTMGSAFASFNIFGVAGPAIIGGRAVYNHAIPQGRANCMVRVFGKRYASKERMAEVALAVAMDRFGGALKGRSLLVVGAYLTQDIGSDNAPFVELRVEFLTGLAQLALIFSPRTAIIGAVNLATNVDPAGLQFTQDRPPAQLPYSDNTRGTWIGSMAYQALASGACDLPTQPAATDSRSDASRVV